MLRAPPTHLVGLGWWRQQTADHSHQAQELHACQSGGRKTGHLQKGHRVGSGWGPRPDLGMEGSGGLGFRTPPPSVVIPSPGLWGYQGERGGILGPRMPSWTRRAPPSAISARSGHRRTGVQSVAALTPWPGSARHTQGLGSARTPGTPTTPHPSPTSDRSPASAAAAARDPADPASPGFHWLPEQPLSRSPAVAQATRPASSWAPRLPRKGPGGISQPRADKKRERRPSKPETEGVQPSCAY